MSEEKKSKKCRFCNNYNGYYVKGLRHFESIKRGYCRERNIIVDNNDYCECWKTANRKKYIRRRVATRALYEILINISAIRQILQENQDDEDNL